ncbi:DNA-binding protein [Amycolatopsis sp. WAC 04169]|uniref:holo-ACP synthase n=1 Tax=Amycolatopsis sp. WAC 04169 TaxID=2203197 RepID=UPI000F772911|nr:4'-phosphopantetheinyl transferase superfamily protein [Amycolatopsis sp. WAC 04169]RSN29124.1 DNA-binding protein [Amycolatopsis sp. WAC 04169]
MTTLVGVDALRVAELDLLARRGWFLKFLFSQEEIDELATAGSICLACRFAAKEAVLKMLRTCLSGSVPPAQIVIRRSGERATSVELRGVAAERARALGIDRVDVSISCERGLVIAVALGTA